MVLACAEAAKSWRVVWRWVAAVGLSLGLGSCVSLEEIAPPVDAAFVEAVSSTGPDAGVLVRGRDLYLDQCIGCHSPEPIGRYTMGQWREILPRMSEEAGLDDDERLALEGYVFTARGMIEMNAVQSVGKPAK